MQAVNAHSGLLTAAAPCRRRLPSVQTVSRAHVPVRRGDGIGAVRSAGVPLRPCVRQPAEMRPASVRARLPRRPLRRMPLGGPAHLSVRKSAALICSPSCTLICSPSCTLILKKMDVPVIACLCNPAHVAVSLTGNGACCLRVNNKCV